MLAVPKLSVRPPSFERMAPDGAPRAKRWRSRTASPHSPIRTPPTHVVYTKPRPALAPRVIKMAALKTRVAEPVVEPAGQGRSVVKKTARKTPASPARESVGQGAGVICATDQDLGTAIASRLSLRSARGSAEPATACPWARRLGALCPAAAALPALLPGLDGSKLIAALDRPPQAETHRTLPPLEHDAPSKAADYTLLLDICWDGRHPSWGRPGTHSFALPFADGEQPKDVDGWPLHCDGQIDWSCSALEGLGAANLWPEECQWNHLTSAERSFRWQSKSPLDAFDPYAEPPVRVQAAHLWRASTQELLRLQVDEGTFRIKGRREVWFAGKLEPRCEMYVGEV